MNSAIDAGTMGTLRVTNLRLFQRGLALMLAVAVTAGLAIAGPASAQEGATTERVSVANDESEGDSHSFQQSVSADGRFVAFSSSASNLVAGDTNDTFDIFVRDRETGETERVSVSSNGDGGDSASLAPDISGDGRYVVFQSNAQNLIDNDANGAVQDIYIRDRDEGSTELVSIAHDGSQNNQNAQDPAVSDDGQVVAFHSDAYNLVPEDNNGHKDVFVRDRNAGTIERVSVTSDGSEAGGGHSTTPKISADGQVVAFHSEADNLSGSGNTVYVHERSSGQTDSVSATTQATLYPGLSPDGNVVAFTTQAPLVESDTNETVDVYAYERDSDTTERVSVASDGSQTQNRNDSQSQGTRMMSTHGRFVAFISESPNLVDGDTNEAVDTFVRDRQADTTTRVSVDSDGTEGNGDSGLLDNLGPSMSPDGLVVAFPSLATNLVDNDTNGSYDVFARVRPAQPADVSLAPQESTNTVGEEHEVTATVTDDSGNALSGLTVQFEVSGDNSASGSADTDGSGEASFTYTGENAGSDTITAFADANGNGSQDDGEPSDTASKTWEPPRQASELTLEPQDDTNQVGEDHTVTATVSDQDGAAMSGVTVEFEVSGAHSTSGSDDTDGSGEAEFAYTGENTGDDTITAFADSNGNGSQDDGEPSDTASKTWLPAGEVPEPPEGPEPPELPSLPGAPEPPEGPGLPEFPGLPGAPEPPEGPGLPELPSLPGAPEPPEGPGDPDAPEQVTVSADVDAEGLAELCASADDREECEELGEDASGELEATVTVSRDAAGEPDVSTEECADDQDGVVLALSGLEAGSEVGASFHGEVTVDGETEEIDESVGPVQVGASGEATASVCASASADAGGDSVDTGDGAGRAGGLLQAIGQSLGGLF